MNTAASEGSLRLLPDELSGYLHSSFELLHAVRPDLTSPFTLSPVTELNTADIEQEPTITPDGLMMVFRRRVGADDELFYALRSSPSVPFDPPVLITELSNVAADTQPFLSPGDSQLYFQSLRDGPDQDIYRSTWVGTTFTAPVLVEEVRANNEGDPVLSFDGLDLYWRSTRPGGLGGYDIWTAHRDTLADPFNSLTPVTTVNSIVDDGPSWVSPDGCRLYLASRRDGNFDLFVASRP